MPQPLEYEQITKNNANDGEQIVRTSTGRLAFYGATPIARPYTASTNAVSTATTLSISTGGIAVTGWGFASQVELNNFVTAVSTMQYTLKQLGIMAS